MSHVLSLPTISANRSFSETKITQLKNQLSRENCGADVSVAAAGSLGRLEASEQSDLDYILIGYRDHPDLRVRIHDSAARIGLKKPNPQGVFVGYANPSSLTQRIGKTTDTYDELSRRMLLLLESQPIYNDARVFDLITLLTETYLKREAGRCSFSFLVNDLNRYFRTICVNNESKVKEEPRKWAVRNTKLKHSRIIMYCGLLFLIARASGLPPKTAYGWFSEHLKLTPLERIARVYEEADDSGFHIVATAYNKFLEHLSDQTIRDELNALSYTERNSSEIFVELQQNSNLMIEELCRFLFSHSERWGPRFLSRLVL